MKKISCRKNKKKPHTAQRDSVVIIELNQPAQQYGRGNRSDSGDDKPGSKITSTDVSDQPKEARKERVKRKRAVPRLVAKFCNLLVIAEVSLIPRCEPSIWGWCVFVPKHGITFNSDKKDQGLDRYYPTDHDPVFAREESNESLNCLQN